MKFSATVLLAGVLFSSGAYETENLIDSRIFEPYSFGQIHPMWGQYQPWQKPLDYFQVKNGIMTLRNTPGNNGQARVQFRTDYETADRVRVSFEYQYDGKQPLSVFTAYSPEEKYYWQKLAPSKDFVKAELEFPLPARSWRGSIGFLSREKNTSFSIRDLVLRTVDVPRSGGDPVHLDGKVCKVIYYAGKNAIDEHYNFFAAKILRSTLANAGCELLPLKKYNGEKLDGAILIQSTEKNSALGEGGYRLRITRGAATITGVRPGGAELGVLALWEKLGIRYYVPCEATLLTRERNASPCDETRVPGIPLRQWDPDRYGWGERLGYQEGTREIANYRYFGGDPVHSLPAFLNENEFRKTHPEYFALQSDGKRGCSQPGHLCLTNPEVISIVAGRILEVVARQPESKYFHIFWGDGGNFYCKCDACKKVGHEKLNITFVSRIAKIIGEKYPDVFLFTEAYVDSRFPPHGIAVPPNVIVEYCPYAPVHMNSFQWEHPMNRQCLKDLAEWETLLPGRMGAFIYPASCREIMNIWPVFSCNADQVKHFAEKKYRILRTCGSFPRQNSIPQSNNFFALNMYALGRIAINPDLNRDTLVNEFMKEYYGKAAPEMRAYLDLMLAEVKRRDFGYNTEYIIRGFCTPEFARKAYALFRKAEDKCKNEPKYLARVQSEKRYLLWTDLSDNNRVNGKVGPKELPEFAEKLAEYCWLSKKEGVSYMNSNYAKWFWETALLKVEDNGQTFYERPMVKKFMAAPLDTLLKGIPKAQIATPYGFRIPASGMLGGERCKSAWLRASPIDVCILRRSSSGFGVAKAILDLKSTPSGDTILKINGIDNEKKASALMEISVNGKKIFTGNVPWGKEKWTKQAFRIPAGVLKKGENEIVLANITPDTEKDGIGGVAFLAVRNYYWGWFMISEMEFYLTEC